MPDSVYARWLARLALELETRIPNVKHLRDYDVPIDTELDEDVINLCTGEKGDPDELSLANAAIVLCHPVVEIYVRRPLPADVSPAILALLAKVEQAVQANRTLHDGTEDLVADVRLDESVIDPWSTKRTKPGASCAVVLTVEMQTVPGDPYTIGLE